MISNKHFKTTMPKSNNGQVGSAIPYERFLDAGICSVWTGQIEKWQDAFSPYFTVTGHYKGPNIYDDWGRYEVVLAEAWILLRGNRSSDYTSADKFSRCTVLERGLHKLTWHHVFMGYVKNAKLLGQQKAAAGFKTIQESLRHLVGLNKTTDAQRNNLYDLFGNLVKATFTHIKPFSTEAATRVRDSSNWWRESGDYYWLPCAPKKGAQSTKDLAQTGHPAYMQLVPALLHESTYKHLGSANQWDQTVGKNKDLHYDEIKNKSKFKVSANLSAAPRYSAKEVSDFERKLDIKLPKLAKELYRGNADLRELKLKCGLRSVESRSSYELDDTTVETLFPLEIEGDKKQELIDQDYLKKGDFNPSVERSFIMHTNEQSRSFLKPPVPNAIPFGWDEFGELLYISDDMVFRYEHEFDRFTPFIRG